MNALIIPLEKHSLKHRFFEMVIGLNGSAHRAYIASYLMLLAIASRSWTVPANDLIKDEKKHLGELEHLGWIQVHDKTILLLDAFKKQCEKQVSRYLDEFETKENVPETDTFMVGIHCLYVPKARNLLNPKDD